MFSHPASKQNVLAQMGFSPKAHISQIDGPVARNKFLKSACWPSVVTAQRLDRSFEIRCCSSTLSIGSQSMWQSMRQVCVSKDHLAMFSICTTQHVVEEGTMLVEISFSDSATHQSAVSC